MYIVKKKKYIEGVKLSVASLAVAQVIDVRDNPWSFQMNRYRTVRAVALVAVE